MKYIILVQSISKLPTYVAKDERRTWDGSWSTTRRAEARTWNTWEGAMRWLSQRESIIGRVISIGRESEDDRLTASTGMTADERANLG